MNFPYFKNIIFNLGQTFVGLFTKDGWLLKGLTALVFFFQGIHLYLACIAALTMIDVLSGVYAAMKTGEPFSSRKFRRGLLEKLLLYLLLLLAICFVDMVLMKAVDLKSFYMSGFITFLIALYEMSSIMENIQKVRPDIKFLKPLASLFKKMEKKTLKRMEDNFDGVADQVTDINNHLKETEEPIQDVSGDVVTTENKTGDDK